MFLSNSVDVMKNLQRRCATFSPNIQSCSILNGPISFCCSIRFGIGLVQIYSSTLVHYSGFSFTHFITVQNPYNTQKVIKKIEKVPYMSMESTIDFPGVTRYSGFFLFFLPLGFISVTHILAKKFFSYTILTYASKLTEQVQIFFDPFYSQLLHFNQSYIYQVL